MFIIKFNKMIHNKWVWGAFATVVVIAFAFSDIVSDRRARRDTERGGVGRLNGEDVSYREFDLVRAQVRMETEGRGDPDRDIDMEVWQRIAVLRSAREMGVTVSDAEVMQNLQRNPAFQGEGGAFDSQRYRYVVEEALRMPQTFYEAVLRNQILIAKTESAVAAGAWGVPSVAAEQARGMTDIFTVRVATISNTFASAELPVKEDELESFHKERLATYHVPEKIAVRYVEFPAAQYRDKVTIVEDEVRDFYDAHLDKYQINTNGTPETLPFEDARGIVESELKAQGARELAADAAADFADVFYLGADTLKDADFERIVAEQSLAVRTTALFSADSQPVAVDRTAPFAASAFDLDPESPRDRFSDAVVGKDASYVLAFLRRTEAYDPALADVRDRVVKDYLDFARNRAFAEHVDKVRGTVGTEMAKDRKFEEVVAELKLSLGTNMTVTALDAYGTLPGGRDLAVRMTRMGTGEVTPAVFTDDGAVFLQVLERKPGEDLQRRVMSNQLASQLRNALVETLRDEWRRFNLGRMKLETNRGPELDVADDDADGAP